MGREGSFATVIFVSNFVKYFPLLNLFIKTVCLFEVRSGMVRIGAPFVGGKTSPQLSSGWGLLIRKTTFVKFLKERREREPVYFYTLGEPPSFLSYTEYIYTRDKKETESRNELENRFILHGTLNTTDKQTKRRRMGGRVEG